MAAGRGIGCVLGTAKRNGMRMALRWHRARAGALVWGAMPSGVAS